MVRHRGGHDIMIGGAGDPGGFSRDAGGRGLVRRKGLL